MKLVHVAAFLCLALLHGCAGDAASWIRDVRAASAEADAAEARGDAAAAARALERITEGEVPEAVAAEDARVVRQDAFARLAQLRLDRGDPVAALADVDRGLVLGEREDLFTANLWAMRGRALEAAGRDREAARDYHRALIIHEALLDRALGEGP